MSLTQFMMNAGFKILAMLKLSSCEYSILMYVMNCSASGISELLTNYVELASLTKYKETELKKALLSLIERRILSCKDRSIEKSDGSIAIVFEPDVHKWKLNFSIVSSKDAIVYPFKRDGNQKPSPDTVQDQGQWHEIISVFVQGRSLSEEELEKEKSGAKTLVETHPVEQILLILEHFAKRIRSLDLLASSWNHFYELYEEETQKVDFAEARKKHDQLDAKLKEAAAAWLAQRSTHKFSDEELAVLKLLINHKHPRRQLFWAYQSRDRYRKLIPFFKENKELMLSVTTGGHIVKKKS